jgi:hypothetical protein
MALPLLSRAALLLLLAPQAAPRNGAPAAAPAGFDCALGRLQLEFARSLQPFRRGEDFSALSDALQLSSCPGSVTAEAAVHTPAAAAGPRQPNSPVNVLIVDCGGSDGSSSSSDEKLHAAVAQARTLAGPTEVQVHGVCYLQSALQLTAADSGLIIRGADGSGATLVGGKPLQFSGPWRQSTRKPANSSSQHVIFERPLAHAQKQAPQATGRVRALRLDGQPCTLARYPNGDSSRDLFPVGWVAAARDVWIPPNSSATPPTASAIESRPHLVRNDTLGILDRWEMGIGGRCDDMSPPAGYWCINDPSGWMGAGDVHRHPRGLIYRHNGETAAASLLPHAPYANASAARLTAFSTGDHWFTWHFDEMTEHADHDGNRSLIFGRGGTQGAEGFDSAAQWYIDGPIEELDQPNEFVIQNQTLYYIPNGTGNGTAPPPDGASSWVVPGLVVLINASGTQEAPVQNLSIVNLTIRDAANALFEPHNMPSGGDWACVMAPN